MAIPKTTAKVWISPEREEDRFLLEGPREVEVDGDRAIAWVNIQTDPQANEGAVWVHFDDEDLDHFHLTAPGRPGFLLPTDRPGVVLVGATKELVLCDLSEADWSESLAGIDDLDPRTIINDGEIVPGGDAVVFGTKDTRFADKIAALYLFTLKDREVTQLAGRQTCSNGKVFGKDEKGLLLFDIDTPEKVIVRYRLDLKKRTLSDREVVVDLRSRDDFPDGMCNAGDGSVIVAFYHPGDVTEGRAVRFDLATGKALEEWITPGSPRVTSPLLVKRGSGVRLVLTTAVEGMDPQLREKCPNAGAVFIAETKLTRIPEPAVLHIRGDSDT